MSDRRPSTAGNHRRDLDGDTSVAGSKSDFRKRLLSQTSQATAHEVKAAGEEEDQKEEEGNGEEKNGGDQRHQSPNPRSISRAQDLHHHSPNQHHQTRPLSQLSIRSYQSQSKKKEKEHFTSRQLKVTIDNLLEEVHEEATVQQREQRAAQHEMARIRASFSAGASAGASAIISALGDDYDDDRVGDGSCYSDRGSRSGRMSASTNLHLHQEGHRQLAATVLTTTMLAKCEAGYNKYVRTTAQDALQFRKCVDQLCPDLSDAEYRERLSRACRFTYGSSSANSREGFMFTEDLLHTILKISLLEDGLQSQEEFETLAAFVQLGGDPDKGGFVDADVLRDSLKAFHLTVDVDAMIMEVDEDGSGVIEFGEFEELYAGLRQAAEREKLLQEEGDAAAAVGAVTTTGDSEDGEDTLDATGTLSLEGGQHQGGGGGRNGGGRMIYLEPPAGGTDSISFKLNQAFQAHRLLGKDLMRKTRNDNPEVCEMFNTLELVTMGGHGVGCGVGHGGGSRASSCGTTASSRMGSVSSTHHHHHHHHGRSFSVISDSSASGAQPSGGHQHHRTPTIDTDLATTTGYLTPARVGVVNEGGGQSPPDHQHTAVRRGSHATLDEAGDDGASSSSPTVEPPQQQAVGVGGVGGGELHRAVQAGSPSNYTPHKFTRREEDGEKKKNGKPTTTYNDDDNEEEFIVREKVSPPGSMQETYAKKDRALAELQRRRCSLQRRLADLKEESERLSEDHSRQMQQQRELRVVRQKAQAEDRATRLQRAQQAVSTEEYLYAAAVKAKSKVRGSAATAATASSMSKGRASPIRAAPPKASNNNNSDTGNRRPQSAASVRSDVTRGTLPQSDSSSYIPSGNITPAPCTTSYYLTAHQGDAAALTPRGMGASGHATATAQKLRTPVQPVKTQYTPIYAKGGGVVAQTKMVNPYEHHAAPRRALSRGDYSMGDVVGGGNYNPGGGRSSSKGINKKVKTKKEQADHDRKMAFFSDAAKFSKMLRTDRLNLASDGATVTPRESRRKVELVSGGSSRSSSSSPTGEGPTSDQDLSPGKSTTTISDGANNNETSPNKNTTPSSSSVQKEKGKKKKVSVKAPRKPMDRWLRN